MTQRPPTSSDPVHEHRDATVRMLRRIESEAARADRGLRRETEIDIAYSAQARVFAALEDGEPPTPGDATLLEGLGVAGQAYIHRSDPFAGPRIDRTAPWSEGMAYSNPFPEIVGSDLTTLAIDHPPTAKPAIPHSHAGEEYIFLIDGDLTVSLRSRQADKHSRTRPIFLAPKDAPGRGLWLRSDIPHAGSTQKGAKYLAFFSHPQGHQPLQQQSISLSQSDVEQHPSLLEEATPDWYSYSGIGTSIKFLRQRRGLTTTDLASDLRVHTSNVSRIESGKLVPSLAQLIQIANTLNVSIWDLFPTGSDYVYGCYLHRASQIDLVSKSPSKLTAKEQAERRLLIPYRWRGHSNLRVLLTGSPTAKRLLPMTLYVGEPADNDWGELGQTLGRQNQELLEHRKGAVYAHGSALVLYAIDGVAHIAVTRYPGVHLIPYAQQLIRQDVERFEAATDKSSARRGQLVDVLTLQPGEIAFVRSDLYAHALLPSTSAKLLCVTHRTNGVGTAIGIPRGKWLDPLEINRPFHEVPVLAAVPPNPDPSATS